MSNYAASWNATGHRLIAQIAFDQLPTKLRYQCIHLNRIFNQTHTHYSWVDSAIWMDKLHGNRYLNLKNLHYIDLPFSQDHSPLPPIADYQIISAIQQYIKEFQYAKPQAINYRTVRMRFLMHLIADIHQPMHAINRISNQYPHGDRGGNDYILANNTIGHNLHKYWDQGAGYLHYKHRPSAIYIRHKAKLLEKQYPCTLHIQTIDPIQWSKESFKIAKDIAYNTPQQQIPTIDYQRHARFYVKKRIAQAGCRLAHVLICILQPVACHL